MQELPMQIQKAVRNYKPIIVDGLTLYPIAVKEFDEWQTARLVLETLQASLPVAFLSKPLLQAYYELDYLPALMGKGPSTGIWGCAMLALALALRLGQGLPPEKRITQIYPVADSKDPKRLKAVRALLHGEEQINITPAQFQRIRPIIAAQNGLELEDDNADPELVRAEREIAAQNSVALNVTLEQTIASVCALTGADEDEINEWPIRKLNTRAASIQRALDYVVCGIGGAFGGFKKGGNPVPHPFYPRSEKQSAHMALGDFANGAGERAVANAGGIPARN